MLASLEFGLRFERQRFADNEIILVKRYFRATQYFGTWERGEPSFFCQLTSSLLSRLVESKFSLRTNVAKLNHRTLTRNIHDGGLRYHYVRTARLHR